MYILVAILALLGGFYQQQNTSPNQEIVLRFADADVTSSDAQDAVTLVTKQLQLLGADHIQVNQDQKGTLKITYYSDADVALIKKTLSKEKEFEDNVSSTIKNKKSHHFPAEESSLIYNLDIYEIQKSIDVDWSLEGTIVLELKSESDRGSNSLVYTAAHILEYKGDRNIKVAYKALKNRAIAIDNASYVIPEVRAGPSFAYYS